MTHLFHPIPFLQALDIQNGTLRPSSCTWSILENAGIVPKYRDFYSQLQAVNNKDEISLCPICPEHLQSLMHILMIMIDNTIAENEGFTQSNSVPVIAIIVQILNELVNHRKYRYHVYPETMLHTDRRENKKSDVSIIRIYNSRTFVLVQCKLSVGIDLNPANISPVAQLFLEAMYTREKENLGYEKMLCILTDWRTWHFFLLNLRSKLLVVENYIRIVTTNLRSTTASGSTAAPASVTESTTASGSTAAPAVTESTTAFGSTTVPAFVTESDFVPIRRVIEQIIAITCHYAKIL